MNCNESIHASQRFTGSQPRVHSLIYRLHSLLTAADQGQVSPSGLQWNSRGTAFTANSLKQLTEALSGNMSGHASINIRKALEALQFRMRTRKSGTVEFYHPFFRRGSLHQLCLIKRKSQVKKANKIESRQQNSYIPFLSAQLKKLNGVVQTMARTNNNLVQVNNVMKQQMNVIKADCESMLQKTLKVLIGAIYTPEAGFLEVLRNTFTSAGINSFIRPESVSDTNGANCDLLLTLTAQNGESLYSLFERVISAHADSADQYLKSGLHRDSFATQPDSALLRSCITFDDAIDEDGSIQLKTSVFNDI